MPRLIGFCFCLALLAINALLGTDAQAAKLTDVIDAADGDDPYDFNVEVVYSRSLRRAKITREYNCPQNDKDRENACPGIDYDKGTIVHAKELRYQQVIHKLTPRLRFGIWHDLELSIEAPVVLSNGQDIRFAGNGGDKSSVAIDPDKSSVAPKGEAQLFPVPTDGLPTRAGFGDMQFMLRWSPINQERDESRGTWTVELGYRAPTGQTMKRSNTGVGRGIHEIEVATALSRRYRYVDPFARLHFVIPIPAGDTLFKDYKDSQVHVGPGAEGGFDVGMEIVPYEDLDKDRKFFITIGLGAVYHAKGRDYSELFDALAIGGETCDRDAKNGDVNCPYYNPDSGSELRNTPHDGITTVEQHGTFKSHIGIGFHAGEYVRMGIRLGLDHDSEHFISTADIGRDLDDSGKVEPDTPARPNTEEHNPTFVSAIDMPGRRLRVEETTVFTAAFHAALQF